VRVLWNCAGEFIPISGEVSVVEAEAVCDGESGEGHLAGELTVLGPIDTSSAPLHFDSPVPPPPPHDYYVKACRWCNTNNRRQFLRVTGLLYGMPVAFETFNPLINPILPPSDGGVIDCDQASPDSCAYFLIDPVLYAADQPLDEFWGAKHYGECKFFN
jgi:hypothetical protein